MNPVSTPLANEPASYPNPLTPNPSSIPEELTLRPQWLVWRMEIRDGKPTKVPYSPQTGLPAKTTDPATWSSFDWACQRYQRGGFHGIGLVLAASDPYVFIDLDHCIEDGVIADWARTIVEEIASYTEYSPSGSGIHILALGHLPANGRKKGNIEMYDQARYCTVTGHSLPGSPFTLCDAGDAILALHNRVFGPQPPAPPPIIGAGSRNPILTPPLLGDGGLPGDGGVSVTLDDATLLQKARSAANGAAFDALWRGNTSGYPSDSEADMALCHMLAFWTGKDARRIDLLFRRSGLIRPKWDERRGETTWGWRTIAKALENVTEFYDPARSQSQASTLALLAEGGDRSWPSPLTLDAYHGLAGDVVQTIAPHTEADEAALLIQFLAAFGNAINRYCYFRAEADKHYGNLFACLVGVSSKGRKGTSWGHIQSLLELADRTWAVGPIASGLSSGEGLIYNVRDPIQREKVDKETHKVEIELIDKGVSDKRLFVMETEFASALRSLSREGNTLSAIMRQAWDTGHLRTLTKNSPTQATNAHVSIIGHITKDELLRYLDRTETANGLANRFLWLCVRRSKELPEGGSLTGEDMAPLAERLTAAISFGKNWSIEGLELTRDDQARLLWIARYHDLSEGKPGLLGAVTSRAEAQVMRLAMLYALLDSSALILRPHLLAALELWRYAEDSARYIFGDALGDPLADELLRALRDHPEGLSRSQINDHFQRHQSTSRMTQALALLAELGLARRETHPTEGRPLEVWLAVSER